MTPLDSRSRIRGSQLRAWHACAAYGVIALLATWPLARGLGSDVAWDLGDPVMVMWALAWNCSQIASILGGDVSRISTFFDANIFYPAPLTLAYSEHFFAQAVQILPIYALTENPILCYNLLFLSTFVLSGLGAFLLVRELTGNPTAGFVAGLFFAFAPYRIPQSSHLQVLSSQWMPLALYGFRRYFDTRRVKPLMGATVALVVQNLSCAYYFLYFSPFAAAYVAWEMAGRHLWRSVTVWRHLGVTAAMVLAFTAPFLLPYAAVRDQLHVARATGEVMRYSADVYSYLTAFSEQPIWGRVAHAFPKPEGQLFPGLLTLALAAIGLLDVRAGFSWPFAEGARREAAPPRRRWVVRVLASAVILHLAAVAAALLYRRVVLEMGPFVLQVSDINRLLIQIVVLVVVLLFVSPGTRARAATFMKSRGFFVVALLAAAWLSLGPSPQSLGRPLNLVGPYRFLYEHVPGFEGVRVPARFGMVVTLMLAVLAGFGASRLAYVRGATAALAVACVAFLAEGLVVPFVVNGTAPIERYNPPEARLYPPSRAPVVYAAVAREPDDMVLAELPLGHPDFDLRAMFYSAVHRRRLLNGYSGFFPAHYGQLRVALSDVLRQPDLAWQAVRNIGATHILVHEGAYLGSEGPLTSSAFRERGAVEVVRDHGDVLLRLP